MHASANMDTIHELSDPGQRPLCGADPAPGSAPPEATRSVDCGSCLRLLDDDVRRAAHAGRPRVEESED